jgi:hypothetical protein
MSMTPSRKLNLEVQDANSGRSPALRAAAKQVEESRSIHIPHGGAMGFFGFPIEIGFSEVAGLAEGLEVLEMGFSATT